MSSSHALLICFLILPLFLFAQGPDCRSEARIDLAYDQYGLSGEGVLAIVMDRGVDYRHPDFIDADGNTRIAYIYDLYDDTGANDPDNPYGVGTIYDADEINQSLQQGGTPLTNDIFGHGTATTGIFAGNGTAIAEETLYRGVAYEATIIHIIVTKDFVPPFGNNPGQPGQFNPGLLPTAFAFAEDKITELGLPSVTLLNIGSIGNPTDGSTSFCAEVDAFVANGHPFVCGVGDDGGQDNHAIEQLELNTTTTFEIEKGEPGNLRFNAWYDDAARCTVTIERPDGTVEGPFSPPLDANTSSFENLGNIIYYHQGANTDFAGSTANWRQLLIDFSGPTGLYKVHLETTELGSETVAHGMLNPSRYFNDNRFVNFSEAGGNINDYSACFPTISPGDYVANTTYVDVNGITRVRDDAGDVGELWLGSSAGPTMDGRLGIDLVGPGELAVGAYSLDSYYGNFPFNTMENSEGYYGIQNAVSGAAPIVAGVIALLLEADPNLTPAEILTILQESAREDSFTGTTPNVSFGHGKLDALAATETILASTDHIETTSPLSVYPNPVSDAFMFDTEGAFNGSCEVSVFSLAGDLVFRTTANPGEWIHLADMPQGAYLLRVRSEDRTGLARLIKLN